MSDRPSRHIVNRYPSPHFGQNLEQRTPVVAGTGGPVTVRVPRRTPAAGHASNCSGTSCSMLNTLYVPGNHHRRSRPNVLQAWPESRVRRGLPRKRLSGQGYGATLTSGDCESRWYRARSLERYLAGLRACRTHAVSRTAGMNPPARLGAMWNACDLGWTAANGPVETLPFDPPLSRSVRRGACQAAQTAECSSGPLLTPSENQHALT